MTNIKLFQKEAERIHQLGFVKARGKGTSQVGITYELLLGKKMDNLERPDFHGIEIKTLTKSCFYCKKVVLFRAVPDSYLFEMYRLVSTYGIQRQDAQGQKTLYLSVSSLSNHRLKNGYQFRLVVDREREQLILLIRDQKNQLIDTNARWSFKILKEKLQRKLSYLAFVKADRKWINNEKYFSYDFPKIYQLKSFDTFLKLIESGVILLYFNIGIKDGKSHDHGTSFIIHPNKLSLLFDEICERNTY